MAEIKKIRYNQKRKVFAFNCYCGHILEKTAFSLHSKEICPICHTEFMIGKDEYGSPQNKGINAQEIVKY